MLLQPKLEELNSAIFNVCDDHIIVTGFCSEERLTDYYVNEIDCRYSLGLYPKEKYDVAYLKDNALLIVLKEGKEVARHKFVPIKKDIIKFKDPNDDNKLKSHIYYIRTCTHTNKYNYKDTDLSILFDNVENLEDFYFDKFKCNLII
ncbi:MAG: hypothetical protein ACOWWH_00845 [Eubacteriaceae bacterium]